VLNNSAYVHTRTRSRFALAATTTFAMWLALAASAAHAVTNGPLPAVGSTGLPDNRGYELVTPAEKLFNNVSYAQGYNQLSASGESATFSSGGGFGPAKGVTANTSYLATRQGAGQWLTQGLTAPQSPSVIDFGQVWNSDASLSKTLVDSSAVLAPGGSSAYGGVYLADNLTGTYELVFNGNEIVQPGVYSSQLRAVVGTPDFSHVLIQTGGGVPTASSPAGVFDFTAGQLQPVGILPGGATAVEARLGGIPEEQQPGDGYPKEQRAISSDGSRIFFTAASEGSGARELYVRENDQQTVLISHPSSGVVDPNGEQGVNFGTASADGSVVFFTSQGRLTSDSTARPYNEESGQHESADLYRFELSSGQLTDLTTADPEGGQLKSVLGASENGDYIYFDAGGVLAPGGTEGAENVYVEHGGITRYIGQAPATASGNPFGRGEDSRVTPDGLHLEFDSNVQTTSYDNAGQNEYYIYDYPTDELRCATCNPSGRPPSHGNYIASIQIAGGSNAGRNNAARALSEDGSRFFFTSEESLLPQDTNGVADVYEWENGTVYLISSGTSAEPSRFGDSSANGNDATFVTSQSLVSQDRDVNSDVYDARVNGGTAVGLAPPACTGTGCQGVSEAPPIFATPASNTFNGIGNFSAAPKAAAKSKKSVKKKVKPKKKPKKKPKPKAKKKPKRKSKQKGKQAAHRKQALKSQSSRVGR
jgi:hypothetical protein